MALITTAIDMFFGTSNGGSIAGLRLDAILSDSVGLRSTVTQWAVEEGSPVSDAIIPGSPTLQIEGIVTNAGVVLLDGIVSGSFESVGENKLNAARDQLTAAYKARTPITLVASNVTYLNYGMESCNIVRRGNGQDGELSITANFIKIRKAALQTTKVTLTNVANKVKGKAGATKATTGKAATTSPDSATAEKASSIAYSLLYGGS